MNAIATATRHLIPISGKDSLATALIQTTHEPSLSYEFLFNDTGCELPETYEWLGKVEQKTGWQIERVGKSLEAIIEGYGGFLPGQRSRYCTREAKIQPMEQWLTGSEAIVYYGLRADEQRTGYVPVSGSKIQPVYPLQNLGIDLQGVYSILQAQDLLPPTFFWNRLYEAVDGRLRSLGNWQESLAQWQFNQLFAGRTRANCYFCFYQRQYELLWLYEAHPNHFWKAAGFEKPDYTWRDGYHFTEFDNPEFRDRIFKRRVDQVVQIISSHLQGSLFSEPGDNAIALRSCGLLCGK